MMPFGSKAFFIEEPSDIASEVLDDGYIDVMDDKTVALFPLGDMIIPTA